MGIRLNEEAFTSLGILLYHHLKQLGYGFGEDIDLTVFSEKEQSQLLDGLADGLKKDAQTVRRRGDHMPNFSLAASLYRAGAAIEEATLHTLLENRDEYDRLSNEFQLRQLRWLSSLPEHPENDSPEVYEQFITGRPSAKPRRFQNIKSSPQLRKEFTAEQSRRMVDRTIQTELAEVEKAFFEEVEQKRRYGKPNRDFVLSRLKTASDVANRYDYDTEPVQRSHLEQIAFLTRVDPVKGTWMQKEFAWRKTLDYLHTDNYAKLLISLTSDHRELERFGYRLLEELVEVKYDRSQVANALQISLGFFERAAQVKQSHRIDSERELAQQRREVADLAALLNNFDLAKAIYIEEGIIFAEPKTLDKPAETAAPDDTWLELQNRQFREQLVRVADHQVATAPKKKRDSTFTRRVMHLYRSAYPDLRSMPRERANRFFLKADNIYSQEREAFFLDAYGEDVPHLVLKRLADHRLQDGELKRAEELYSQAGIALTPAQIFEQAKRLISYKEKKAIEYFDVAIARGHRRISFKEFFEAHEHSFSGDREYKLKHRASTIPQFMPFLDQSTNAYDYHMPTDTEFQPATYTDLATHYILENLTDADGLLNFCQAMGEDPSRVLGDNITALVQRKDGRKLVDFVKSFNPKERRGNQYPPQPTLFVEQKAVLYGLAVSKGLEAFLEDETFIFLEDEVINFLQEKTRIEQQNLGITPNIRDRERKKNTARSRSEIAVSQIKHPFQESLPRAVQDRVYFDYAKRLADRAVELYLQMKELDVASEDETVQRQRRELAYYVNKNTNLVRRIIEDIENIPGKHQSRSGVVDLRERTAIQEAKRAISRVGEIYCSGDLPDYEDQNFKIGWGIVHRIGLPLSEELVAIVRRKADSYKKAGKVDKAKRELQRIGELNRQTAFDLAEIALKYHDIDSAEELYSMSRRWKSSYAHSESKTEEKETTFGKSAIKIFFRRINLPTGIHRGNKSDPQITLECFHRAVGEVIADGEPFKAIRLEEALQRRGYAFSTDGGKTFHPYAINDQAFDSTINRYTAERRWDLLAELNEKRPALDIPTNIFRHYRGRIPLEGLAEGQLASAIKVIPAAVRAEAEQILTQLEAQNPYKRKFATEQLGLAAAGPETYFENVFKLEFSQIFCEGDRIPRFRSLPECSSLLDSDDFLRTKITEGNADDLRTIAVGALFLTKDYAGNQPLAQVIQGQRSQLLRYITRALDEARKDPLRLNDAIETSVAIADYLQEREFSAFIKHNFLKRVSPPENR